MSLRCLLNLAATFWVMTPHSNAQSAAISRFEVASVKLNKSTDRRPQAQFKAFPAAGRIVITATPVLSVIQKAFGLQQFELVHDDNPVLNQRIDIEAKGEHSVDSSAELQRMLQPLLEERFKLVVHRESREMNAFVLTVAARYGHLGPKMKKSDRDDCDDLGDASTAWRYAYAWRRSERAIVDRRD